MIFEAVAQQTRKHEYRVIALEKEVLYSFNNSPSNHVQSSFGTLFIYRRYTRYWALKTSHLAHGVKLENMNEIVYAKNYQDPVSAYTHVGLVLTRGQLVH